MEQPGERGKGRLGVIEEGSDKGECGVPNRQIRSFFCRQPRELQNGLTISH